MIKRILSALILLIAATMTVVAAESSDNRIQWESTSHDFGNIRAADGKVKAEYTFINNTGSAIAILSVTNGGCGCTVPKFPKKPVDAGAKGTVTITFDPARFKGEFKRQVTVTILSGNKRVKTKLRFSGYIIP